MAEQKYSNDLSALPGPRSEGTIQKSRVRQAWPEDRDFRILAIDGGGIRGILPAAFLAELELRYLQGKSVGEHFDLIAGTSTGGIIAVALGAGLSARKVLELYAEHGNEVFPPGLAHRIIRRFRSAVIPAYSAKHLERLLNRYVGDEALWSSRTRLCIPSADGRFGEVYIFKTPHHPDYQKDWQVKLVDVCLSTTAAPTYFRPRSDGYYQFIDGGLYANNPVMVALVDAVTCFDIPMSRIHILSLGCAGTKMRLSWLQRQFGGLATWSLKFLDGFMCLQSENATGQAGLLIGRDRLIRIDHDATNGSGTGIGLDDWSRARSELPDIACRLADRHGSVIRSIFLTSRAEPLNPIYTPTTPPIRRQ